MSVPKKSPVVVARSAAGRLEVDVVAVPDWDGFAKLVAFLVKSYDAEVLTQFDGPDARRATLRVRSHVLELVHEDPWGNVLAAMERAGEGLLGEIADDLRGRLEGG